VTIRPVRTISRKDSLKRPSQMACFENCRLGSRERGSSEAIRRAPCRSTGMKRWSRPRSDTGMTVLNYNRPKVAEAPLQARGAAPPNGDVGECSWLFAGKPGASEWYSSSGKDGSDNPFGGWHGKGHTGKPAGNREAGSSETIRQPSRGDEMKRWSDPCGDARRSAEMTDPPREQRGRQVTETPEHLARSEIPCRVDELPHERAISHANRLITGKPSLK
jgi:hypothetical protein